MLDYYSFLTYISIMSFTPGPNTMMSLGSSTRYGFRRTLPFMLGVTAAVTIILCGSTLLGAAVQRVLPHIQVYMKIFGAAYMLYMAYKTFKSSSVEMKDARPMRFIDGMLLQLVNPKSWIYILTTLSVYMLPHIDNGVIVITIIVTLAVVCLASLLFWAFFGLLCFKLFQRHSKLVNTILALLLVYCAVSLFL